MTYISLSSYFALYLEDNLIAWDNEYILKTTSGLEKFTNANRSVRTVNDRLFPGELSEIADWKSISEYMIHSYIRKTLTRVIGRNFGAYTFILPFPYFLYICLPFWMFYQRKEYLNKIKILWNFHEQTRVVFDKPTRVVLF